MKSLDPTTALAQLVGGLPELDLERLAATAADHRRSASRIQAAGGPRAQAQASWHTREADRFEQQSTRAQHAYEAALNALAALPSPEGNTMTDTITNLRARRGLLSEELTRMITTLETESRSDLNDTEAQRVTHIRSECAILDGRIAELDAESTRDANSQRSRGTYESTARIGFEARTYNPQSAREGVSFFADAFQARERSDMQALERQQRHGTEVRVEREQRATSTGSFAGLVVPQYLTDEAALVARAGRPIANSVNRLPLPDQGTMLRIPLGQTGVSVASQAAENTSVSSTDETWNDLLVPVVTIAGQQDVSRQSLERGTPGIDQLIYTDLAAAYATELDRQLIVGTGASGQMLGMLNTAGKNSALAFGAAVTMGNFYGKLAGQSQQIITTRLLPADVVYMHPRRFAWLYSQLDASGRPLVTPAGNGPYNAMGVLKDSAEYGQISGTIQGLPIIQDPSIPFIGTNSEDVVIVARAEDIYLWENDGGMPQQLRFEQTLANQLTVKLIAYGYVASTAARYPRAVGTIGGLDVTAGNGLIAPTNLS